MRARCWIAAGALGFGVCVVAMLGVARVYRLAWRPPVYEPNRDISLLGSLRTWAEHDAIRDARAEPYVLELSGRGELLCYGTAHTRDPDSPFIRDIAERWESFEPTVALCEGRTRFFFFDPSSGVRQFGEPATLVWLSRRDGVPLYSLEPAYADEVARVLEGWDAERVAAYYTLRVFWGEKAGRDPSEFDALAAALLRKRTDVPGLRDSIADVADLDALWKAWFPGGPGWRELDTEPPGSFLAEIADRSREVRAEHMVRTIADLWSRGERAFVVVGSGHVIRQEPMLRATLGLE